MRREPKYFDVSVSTDSEALTTIGSVNLDSKFPDGEVAFEVNSSGGSVIALDQFELQVQTHPAAAFTTLVSDWSAVTAQMTPRYKSATLNTLAHGTAEQAVSYVGPVHAIRFQSAQAGVTASAVTVQVRGIVF